MRDDASTPAAIGLAPGDVLWAAGSLCNLQRVPFDAAAAAHAFPPPHTLDTLIDVLRQSGLAARIVHCPARAIASLPMPCVALLAPLAGAPDSPAGKATESGATPGRLALVVRADGERVLHFVPGSNAPIAAPLEAFGGDFRGIALVAERTESLPADPDALPARRFGFHWFVPELLRHRRVWRDVIAASLALQLVALALPLLSQVIIDRVIVHRATSTLAVIAAALLLAVTFSAALGWIRQYLVLHTGNRVDAVLGSAVFRHLLALPLAYFEHRPTGVLTARLAGIETIREFVAGAAITLALDLPFLAMFLAVMFVYSVPLTLVTLAVVAALVGLSIAVAPALQQRLNDQFLAGARNQAFVTEHLAGIETVKALQLEPQLVRRYEGNLAQALATAFRTRQLGNTYQSLAGALEQLLSITILCLGAWLAMTSAEFTIGMLVAFQMFAARVAQPLLRLAGLWQQFQQAAIAVRRLGDVMDVPAEPVALAATRPRTGPGRIELAGVGFRYGEGRPWLYRGLDVAIAPGECVVITGPSGCGKSTLFKLLLGFAAPVEGAIRIDGRDTRTLAPAEQRARFGVVPQETTLFSGSILDNLQLGNPLASVDQIVQACRLADIHATLEALPDGYRSPVGERGVGLSGGQKQRLALARALLRRPQALLLDEPFSQLDDDAARRIAAAVSRLKGALTILIVSHTLPPTLAYDRRIDLGAAAGENRAAAGGTAG